MGLIFLLAISLSIDALGVGITYGLKKIKIPLFSKMIICIFSIICSAVFLLVGKVLAAEIPSYVANIIGIVILASMGIWFIIKGAINPEISKNEKENYLSNNITDNTDKTLVNIMIKSLGITIHIVKNPLQGDMDGSGSIERKESVLLGLALSMDSIGVSIGSAFAGLCSAAIPLFIGAFQLIFLCAGIFIGISFSHWIPSKLIAFLPGIILLLLCTFRVL